MIKLSLYCSSCRILHLLSIVRRNWQPKLLAFPKLGLTTILIALSDLTISVASHLAMHRSDLWRLTSNMTLVKCSELIGNFHSLHFRVEVEVTVLLGGPTANKASSMHPWRVQGKANGTSPMYPDRGSTTMPIFVYVLWDWECCEVYFVWRARLASPWKQESILRYCPIVFSTQCEAS